jgi:hypothetical protein
MTRAALTAAALLTLAAVAPAAPARAQALACDYGPITREYGGYTWRIFACEDDKTVIFVAGQGNRSTPYVFTYAPGEGDAYVLTGRGAGDPTYVERARAQLAQLRPDQIRGLYRGAKGKGDGG